MPDLIVENVTKEFSTRSEPIVILRGVSLALSAGENLAILGPSGSGKSTLLHIIGTLEPPTSGSVRLGGVDPLTLDEPSLADFRNRTIGFVFQEHHLLPQCTVLENVLLPTIARGRVTDALNTRAKMLLERVGMAHRLGHRPAELSGGERQRVAIARALVLRPALLLADEPTGNLDRTTGAAVGRLLLELQREENNMLIVVTHSADLAGMLVQRYEFDDGQLKQMKELRTKGIGA
jgi:lipoprotein-releasing system ATP-binding protein